MVSEPGVSTEAGAASGLEDASAAVVVLGPALTSGPAGAPGPALMSVAVVTSSCVGVSEQDELWSASEQELSPELELTLPRQRISS